MGSDCKALTAEQFLHPKEALVAGGISLGSMASMAQSSVAAAEAALGSQLQAMQGKTDLGPADLLQAQFAMQSYTSIFSMMSTMNKEISDTLKGIIQKV